MWTWRQLSHCSDSAVTDRLSSSKISASYLKFYAFNYCLLGCWVGNLSSFKIFVIAWSWSRHLCNKSCISCQNNWWNESNLKFNVLSCKYHAVLQVFMTLLYRQWTKANPPYFTFGTPPRNFIPHVISRFDELVTQSTEVCQMHI